MKICVLNFSGNVGKSTISWHLLLPNLPHAKLFSVESINSDESTEDALRGKQFGELIDSLWEYEHSVVDVGASNVEEFLSRMKQYKNSHEDFDLFLIPTVSSRKQQVDTVSTINALSDLGVPSSKIRLLFNKVQPQTQFQKEFSLLFRAFELGGLFTLEPVLSLQENELYELLKGQSIAQLVSDTTDFSQKIKEARSKEERFDWSKKRSTRRLALGIQEELQGVFHSLFPGGV